MQITGNFKEINDELIAKAKDNILLGIAKINKYNEGEKKAVAIHQAAKIIASQVHQTHFLNSISLIPRFNDKILTLFPKSQNQNIKFSDVLLKEIIVNLSGKAAEEVLLEKTVDKTCQDFQEAFLKAQELTNFSYIAINDKDKDDYQKEIIQKCFSNAKALVYKKRNLIQELADQFQLKEITTVDEIEDFQKHNSFGFQLETDSKQKRKCNHLINLMCLFCFFFIIILLLIVLLKIIWFKFKIKNKLFIGNKKIILLIIIIASLMFSMITIISELNDYFSFLPFYENKDKLINASELFYKVDHYEIERMTYITKNSWLDGLQYIIELQDKSGNYFICKLKPMSQNILEQKIATLKLKDFNFIHNNYFDWFNLLIKIVVLCSSCLFAVYSYFNMKRIRKQLNNSKLSVFN